MKREERKQEEALKKKAYEKPHIVHQQSLEVVAGYCPSEGLYKQTGCGILES